MPRHHRSACHVSCQLGAMPADELGEQLEDLNLILVRKEMIRACSSSYINVYVYYFLLIWICKSVGRSDSCFYLIVWCWWPVAAAGEETPASYPSQQPIAVAEESGCRLVMKREKVFALPLI